MYLKSRSGDGYIHDFNFVVTDPSTGHEIVCRVAWVDGYFNNYSIIHCDRNTESILVAELRSSSNFKMVSDALLASLTYFPLTKACSYPVTLSQNGASRHSHAIQVIIRTDTRSILQSLLIRYRVETFSTTN